MIFLFINSVETQLKREMDKAEKKIENIFKQKGVLNNQTDGERDT